MGEDERQPAGLGHQRDLGVGQLGPRRFQAVVDEGDVVADDPEPLEGDQRGDGLCGGGLGEVVDGLEQVGQVAVEAVEDVGLLWSEQS